MDDTQAAKTARRQLKEVIYLAMFDMNVPSVYAVSQDEVVAGVESRISAWTFLPVENGEPMQILHYENGQKYEPHSDYFHDKANQALGGHTIATMLMYLSNVQKGGETVFPESEIRFRVSTFNGA